MDQARFVIKATGFLTPQGSNTYRRFIFVISNKPKEILQNTEHSPILLSSTRAFSTIAGEFFLKDQK